MMQTYEIQQRFKRIEQAIGKVAKSCKSDPDASPQLKDCIKKLDRQSSLAKEVIDSSDTARIRKAVDDLEMLGDEAKRVCGSDTHATQHLREEVLKVHDELSDLKHKLH